MKNGCFAFLSPA